MSLLERAALLGAVDADLRRAAPAPSGGWRVVVDGPLVVVESPGVRPGSTVVWSDLDERTADAAVEQVLARFRARGKELEWKHYGHDRPADLPRRLARAGFRAEPRESLLVAPVGEVIAATAGRTAPDGIDLRHVDDGAGSVDWDRIAELKRAVWGRDAEPLVAELRAERAADASLIEVHLAESGNLLVCAAWVRFHPGTRFASLWGGGTRPGWRRRGAYAALVAARAREAAERGYELLQVDASADSRPVLQRLGFRVLTGTTPWTWSPGRT